MQIGAITWNLFHGRDAPPDRGLFTLRSRLFGGAERNGTHVQVNRDLFEEFVGLLAGAQWDVAVLQEFPPRWLERLAGACGAQGHLSPTSRNRPAWLRSRLARANPDLIGAHEGGSNAILVRAGERPELAIVERREAVLRPRLPERRTMAFVRLAGGLCVANLHASNDRPAPAVEEILKGAELASGWAGEAPLLFGGDLNVRPEQGELFAALAERHGIAGATVPGSIDHLLARGLRAVEPPRAWPASARELPCEGLALRLSDHAPVEGVFESAPAPAP